MCWVTVLQLSQDPPAPQSTDRGWKCLQKSCLSSQSVQSALENNEGDFKAQEVTEKGVIWVLPSVSSVALWCQLQMLVLGIA